MNMESERAFLGRGWSFPPQFDRLAKGVAMLQDERDIESSLEILLSTRLGERVMQPTYGCNLDDVVFESMNLTLVTWLKDLIKNAILYHEARIDLEKLDIDTERQHEGVLLIVLHYRVRTTNSRYNYVYPYYIKEGSSLKS
jgi:uncharacterized protein